MSVLNFTNFCNGTTPDTKELYKVLDDIDGFKGVLIFSGIITPIVLCFFAEAVVYTVRNIPYSDRRYCILWILGVYPIFCVTALLGLFIPRAAGLCTFTAAAYFAVVLFEFMHLIVDYFGGLEAMLLQMKGTKMSVARPPTLCLFFFLPKFEMTRRNFRILEIGVLQVAFLRPLTLFITELLSIDGRVGPTSENARTISLTINSIILATSVTAIQCLLIFFYAARKYLSKFYIGPKFLCVQIALILSNVQSALLSILSRYNVIECYPPFPFIVRGYQWHLFLVTIESSLMLIPTLIFFRTVKGNILLDPHRKLRRTSTFAGLESSAKLRRRRSSTTVEGDRLLKSRNSQSGSSYGTVIEL
ncbi:Organic solute transporter subunit alpha [Holothuria leucospilota]|uniref:Organic solute transporter subunit alpha n=1 Tax=Holothuria leucospilota TaxID=206669 RepID=A0A9Q1CJK0_HOLLE|nr:Organic solute transporter subunit alpha [Holothuria leucospilota]